MQKNMLMKISKSIAVAVTVAMTASMPVTALAAPANFSAAYYAAQNNDTDDTQNDTTPADENQNNTNPTDNTQSSGTQNQPEQND